MATTERARRTRMIRILVRWTLAMALRIGLIVGLGAVAACGFQPLGWWPAMLLGVAGLVWLVRLARGRRGALLVGWLWGVGFFACGLNWIATAFTYQAKMPVWLGWVAVVGLASYLALYPALAGLVAWGLRGRPLALVPGFGAAWIISEWLRSWVFSGFAWNPLGAALLGDFAHVGLAALTPWIGTYGLSGLAAMLGAGVALGAGAGVGGDRRGWALAAGPMVLVGLAMVWPGAGALAPGHIPYTLVQPNIPQAELNDPSFFESQYNRSARLTDDRLAHDPIGRKPHRPAHKLVLWPESGTPEYLRDAYPAWMYQFTFAGDPWLARLRLARTAGEGALLLTGAIDLDVRGSRVIGGRNVITALDDRGDIVGSYAKAHLVPYGEYLPMRDILAPLGLARLVPGEIDLEPGPGPRTLDLGQLGRAGMQICYEIIFSGQVVDRAHRPDYIFNPTNDGWFGAWGPPQHLAQARLRAIEEGVPVLRATTNGISAVIDADGVVRQWAPRDVAARLDGLVPPAYPARLFARHGNIVPLGVAMLLIALSALVLRRGRG